MAKLFSEKLSNLEKEVEIMRSNSVNQYNLQGEFEKIKDLDKRLTDCETKINQLIDEITPILTQHANALKELMTTIRVKQA